MRDSSDSIEAIILNTYILTALCVALAGALIPWMLYRYARRKGFSAPWSATIALTAALATQLLPYATIFMLHVPSGAHTHRIVLHWRRAGRLPISRGVPCAM